MTLNGNNIIVCIVRSFSIATRTEKNTQYKGKPRTFFNWSLICAHISSEKSQPTRDKNNGKMRKLFDSGYLWTVYNNTMAFHYRTQKRPTEKLFCFVLRKHNWNSGTHVNSVSKGAIVCRFCTLKPNISSFQAEPWMGAISYFKASEWTTFKVWLLKCNRCKHKTVSKGNRLIPVPESGWKRCMKSSMKSFRCSLYQYCVVNNKCQRHAIVANSVNSSLAQCTILIMLSNVCKFSIKFRKEMILRRSFAMDAFIRFRHYHD